MARNCPSCSLAMVPIIVDTVHLDSCPKCAGYWFDVEELQRLIKADPEAMARLEGLATPDLEKVAKPGSTMSCPNCSVPLRVYQYMYNSPIKLNTCPQCDGFWVDDGELVRMADWRKQCRQYDPKQEEAIVRAMAEGEHMETMQQQERIRGGFDFMRRFLSGWTGLVP